MKHTKKIGLFLGLAMIFAAVGCSPTSEPSTPTTEHPTSEPSSDPTSDPTSVPTETTTSTTDPTTNPSGETSLPDPSTPTTADPVKEINVTVKDILGNTIEGATIEVGSTTFTTDASGAATVVNDNNASSFSVSKDGFASATFDFPNGDVEIELAYEYAHLGTLVAKKWANYERFSTYVTRTSTNLLIRHIAENEVFTSEGRDSKLETYISTGDTTTREGNSAIFQIVQTSKGQTTVHNYGGDSFKAENVTTTVANGKTVVDISIAWTELKVQKDAIIGISAGLWSQVDSDWAPMAYQNTTNEANVEIPSEYIRCDIENKTFRNSKNEYPKDITYDKEALIAGKPYNVGNPIETKTSAADDIYFSVTATETGFDFDMVGFEDFADNEYIKFVFHTSETDGTGWRTQTSDLSVLVSKTQAKFKTNLTDFWAYTNFGGDEATVHQPTYEYKEEGYFTLNWSLDYVEIPEYAKDKEVSFIAIEFGNGVIYNNDPWINAMMKDGAGVGDPAAQSSYQVIQEKPTSVNKDDLIKDYNIKFSFIDYAKFERTKDGLKLSLLSFDALNDDHYIRFVCDTDGSPVSGGWALDSKDVSFTIYKDKAYVETGKTGFWDGEAEKFHGSNIETLNMIEYVEHGEYWTIDLLIDWTELGLNVNEDSPLKGLLLLFNPSIQNAGFSYDGNTDVGDQALQQNYFTI